ncbi:MAG: cyclic nucleotide-binding domain-containing protein [Cyanobacteria bacterium P01_F01_bin.53]
MLKIAIAKTAQQIDDVLKLRHQVTANIQNPSVKASPLRLMDRFDTFPSTTHLVASKNNCIVGSLRLTFDTPAGTPADAAYDFRTTLKDVPKDVPKDIPGDGLKPAADASEASDDDAPPNKVVSCDQYYVYPALASPQITLGLLLMASYLAISKGITHIISPASSTMGLPLKSLGFTAIAPEQCDRATNFRFVPMVLNIQKDLEDSFVHFSQKNELQALIHAYGCALYAPGEYILRAGTTGDCAFVIADGEVAVKHPGNDQIIDTMGPGEVFGELALLTNQIRSVDIVAKTDVRAMILEKSIFVEQLMAEPQVALKLLQSMGHRMKHLIDYCNVITS